MAVHRATKTVHSWTDEEKTTFKEKFVKFWMCYKLIVCTFRFALFPKNFEKIASFLPNKVQLILYNKHTLVYVASPSLSLSLPPFCTQCISPRLTLLFPLFPFLHPPFFLPSLPPSLQSMNECVRYYYLVKKKENFKQLIRRSSFKRRRLSKHHSGYPINSSLHSSSLLGKTKPRLSSSDGGHSCVSPSVLTSPTSLPSTALVAVKSPPRVPGMSKREWEYEEWEWSIRSACLRMHNESVQLLLYMHETWKYEL